MQRKIIFTVARNQSKSIKKPKSKLMKSSKASIGALHPILFFVGVYVVALFFSIFICSTVFYSLNGPANEASTETNQTEQLVGSAYQASAIAVN